MAVHLAEILGVRIQESYTVNRYISLSSDSVQVEGHQITHPSLFNVLEWSQKHLFQVSGILVIVKTQKGKKKEKKY